MIATMNKNHHFHKINSNKNYFTIYNNIFQLCLIFISTFLFYTSYEKNEINLVIKGEGGEINFLGTLFYKDPSEVIVKGSRVNTNGKIYNFAAGLNDVTIKLTTKLFLVKKCLKE